jgi:hypothetical protein
MNPALQPMLKLAGTASSPKRKGARCSWARLTLFPPTPRSFYVSRKTFRPLGSSVGWASGADRDHPHSRSETGVNGLVMESKHDTTSSESGASKSP